eukprot:CAMPEP_0206847356 /NCGR_PEP_ID=MMETSP0975-20121206/25463_1 /ASSEMBLY_ACC=CAM_ASM_000399 /TAXON_ID=483370 /ORGANISM="non described non described, Strain CCMP2097" /LENGTH=77 /DNA_ID=CAMNT_0054389971 /DNA_START=154 /DNA_END=387 /DNA_ORIENTATION=-
MAALGAAETGVFATDEDISLKQEMQHFRLQAFVSARDAIAQVQDGLVDARLQRIVLVLVVLAGLEVAFGSFLVGVVE